MQVLAHMKREASGLARTTLELCKFTEKLGHKVTIKEPNGGVVWGAYTGKPPDIHTVHSQLDTAAYHDKRPKFLYAHGEPISSVGNGVSFKAVTDLCSMMDAIICFRTEEQSIWSTLRKTYYVPKGVDLEVYKPLDGITEKLSGSPSVLYYENWRGQRNPLYPIIAMLEVWKKYPDARLHLYNCNDKKMKETFDAFIKHAKLWTFVRSLQGPVDDVNLLINRCDIVISGLYPLYARSVEAFGAGKPLICAGYRENDYPYTCDFEPHSMADAVIRCWENYDKHNWRAYAETHHNAEASTKECIKIYERYT